MSKIKSLSVAELTNLSTSPELLPKETEGSQNRKETFIVPDYQRGYRWQKDIHVVALLEDVLDFMRTSQIKTQTYCLQPLVVTYCTDKNVWEVIDGQQRLTTLYLILKAFGCDCFNLIYETRPKTEQFLQNLTEDDTVDEGNPDFYFISQAWSRIKEWRDKKVLESQNFKKEFINTLENQVNVIWYDVESSDRKENIEIFKRLNIGKIPLSESELVKAILLTRIKKIYTGNELALRQAEISNEFYHMETELRKPHKWNFLNAGSASSHTDILLNLIMKDDNPENLTPYIWFEKKIANDGQKAIEFWEKIKSAFSVIDSWFCESYDNTDIYHLAGYLLAANLVNLGELYNVSKERGKNPLKESLHRIIIDNLKPQLTKARALNEDEQNASGEHKERISLRDLEYGSDSELVRRLLLLLNVLSCRNIAHGRYNRFPFELYALEKWSIEHIYPQNPDKPMRDSKDITIWMEATTKQLRNDFQIQDTSLQNDLEHLKKKINDIGQLSEENPNQDSFKDNFNTIRKELINFFSEEPQHEFANLALLSIDDNASLNNAIFPVKRDRIIERELAGKFIPPCTRNIFLKFYSSSNSQPYFWSKDDQEKYLCKMEEILNNFWQEEKDN